VQGVALDEQALHRPQGRQLVVLRGQRPCFGLDAEKLREKILELRSERDQEFGFRLGGGGARPCGHQTIMNFRF
jgi:hypothetical protein